ncbi:MAG: DNA polymerase I [Flavobacteriales bacterium]|nr:DNA polymerase I [Flavobacteriales bacterium]MBT4705839.1 DNA polymerase I [Flavobacteriales bacterium]MBT4931597.1 DNA polymerase I [Flavobacteriales bacterium]MBT5133824.1 DNA polymerase I [Flavobacteriales bacterium]MBT6132378.1 DNA polymerase I [Flavobacteriales bacterium]
MADNKRLFLLDAFALIYRAYYSFISNPRISSKGMNTSAMFGFTNTLYELIRKEQPTHIAVVFDPPSGDKENFRVEQYAEYKANREAMPEDIARSIPYIKNIVKGFRIPVLEVEGFEADDVIGTLAKKAARHGYEVFMMTPDKDYGQLVEDNIFMYKPGRQGSDVEILGPPEICAKYGLERPEQVIDILGMMGDAVDNIPGIPGVGEKTAMKFVQQFGSVEGLYENLDQLKGKLKEKVEANQDLAIMSKQLATIVLDVPIEFNEKELIMEEPDGEVLNEIFTELEFRTFAKRILGEEITVTKTSSSGDQLDLFGEAEEEAAVQEGSTLNIESTGHDYRLIDTPEKRKSLIDDLGKLDSFCFDTETTGIDPLQAELVGMSFSYKIGEAYYVPVPDDQSEAKAIVAEFKSVFENDAQKIGQNIKYDVEVLMQYGVQVSGFLYDTMIAHYLLHPDQKHNMDEMAQYFLNYKPVSIETLIGKKGKNQGTMRDVPIEKITEYASEDADITLQLKEALDKDLEQDHLVKLFREIESPLINVLAKMENEGVNLDVPALEEYSKELEKDVIEHRDKIYKLAGVDFNVDSPKQLGEVLFDHLKIDEKAKKTKSGQYETREDTLQKLAEKHEIIPLILDYRSIKKLKSTYVDSLPEMVNPKTGRVHTNYMQTVAATGRLSSNNPNLQNIPIRTERGRYVRKAFIPRDNEHVLLAADYSQVELRIIAALSGDEGMKEAFRKGHDIHAATAAKVFGVALEDVNREQRGRAKAVNFGIAYGQGAFGLSQNLNISRGEAKEIIDSYFNEFPGLLKYKEDSIERCRERGYAETLLGRRRNMPDINSRNHTVRAAAERNAINAPIQGSAADIIKIAMINIHDLFEQEGFRSKMILQVHDELVFDTHKSELERITPIIRREMETAFEIDVPLVVDINHGINWLEAH